MGTPTVLLFDIDGTLIRSGGAGRAALQRAFDAHCGEPNATSQITFAGMTDHLIVGQGLEAARQPNTLEDRQRVLTLYLDFLRQEVQRSARYEVLPHVQEVLEAVSGLPSVAVGLGTGNLEQGARIKLARGGLNHWFSFGGFGSDHPQRAELIRAGAVRGAHQLGHALERCRVVIIGDTPRDVQAAHAIGATCVGVTTGIYQEEALVAAGADHVADHLGHPALLGWLLGR
jgi:phosphoglycolate phosphatase-like HAD superfamily hydrolase